jgi:hypothetical protein
VARPTVEALCRALRCTPRERAWLLLYADRNVLASAGVEPTESIQLLTYVAEQLHREEQELLGALIGTRRACALSELELLELAATALQAAIARRRGGRATARSTASNDTLRASAQEI